MSSSETVPLFVKTADPEAEIFLVDGHFRLMAKGLGTLREHVAPGLYKVKVYTGARIRERYLLLDPGNEAVVGNTSAVELTKHEEEVTLRFSRVPFTTAVPLDDVSWRRDYHTIAAMRHSAQTHATIGWGGELFVFGRSWTQGEPSPGEQRQEQLAPPFYLTLHDLAGKLLVDLAEQGEKDLKVQDPWMACNIALNPGAYRLRLHTKEGPNLERLVVVSKGWQTQMFLCQLRDPTTQRVTLSPGNGSVHLRRLEEKGFNPSSPGMRMTELARIGLQNDRAVLSPELLEQLQDTESRNPMLGLYGAHLLLLTPEPDLELLRRLVYKLREQLALHPDVEALALRAKLELGSAAVFQLPPMLLKSWNIIMSEARSRPGLVPHGSLASSVADWLWGNSPWVIWKAPALEEQRIKSDEKDASWPHDEQAEVTGKEAATPHLYRRRKPATSAKVPMMSPATATERVRIGAMAMRERHERVERASEEHTREAFSRGESEEMESSRERSARDRTMREESAKDESVREGPDDQLSYGVE